MKSKPCPWSSEVKLMQEDNALKELVIRLGLGKWFMAAKELSRIYDTPRTGKQCRERWRNHLDPSLNDGEWLLHEQDEVFRLAKIHGFRWSKISRFLPGRSENSIKNFFYSTSRKNIRRINKELFFKKKVTAGITEIQKNSVLSGLVFCNTGASALASARLKQQLEEENLRTPGVSLEGQDHSQEITENDLENQVRINLDQAVRQYFSTFINYLNFYSYY